LFEPTHISAINIELLESGRKTHLLRKHYFDNLSYLTCLGVLIFCILSYWT